MAMGVGGAVIFGGLPVPEISLRSVHPKGFSLWPMLFITIACGAISGFHSTQSPIMARCLPNEKYGRRVFYGAMVGEGIIALIWAAAAMSFFPGGISGLADVTAQGGAGLVVNQVSIGLLGGFGGILAILGVIACPITSGDTAFRSARLTIADSLNLDQAPIRNRLYLAIPVLAIGFTLTFIDFSIIWRYFAWSNQTLATIVLWAAAAYLAMNRKVHWMASLPATFMTAVVTTYILQAPEGFQLSTAISFPVGIVTAAVMLGLFLWKVPGKEAVSEAA